ncbi:MAG: hypothetical protein JRG71_09585 [Deltaproteobacteria bacterium]|nr:hypothetical protein [Deltaproteobacteria bacterium]
MNLYSSALKLEPAAPAPLTVSKQMTTQALKNGACPNCTNATFIIIARVDSWGTYLEKIGGPRVAYCETCEQKVQLV